MEKSASIFWGGFFFPHLPANLKKRIHDFSRVSSLKSLWLGVTGIFALKRTSSIKAPTAIGEATRCSGAQRGLRYKKPGRMGVFFLENSVFSSWLDKNLDPTYYSIFLSRVGGFVN